MLFDMIQSPIILWLIRIVPIIFGGLSAAVGLMLAHEGGDRSDSIICTLSGLSIVLMAVLF